MSQDDQTECTECGSKKIQVVFNEKYRGLRGMCTDCGANWPES